MLETLVVCALADAGLFPDIGDDGRYTLRAALEDTVADIEEEAWIDADTLAAALVERLPFSHDTIRRSIMSCFP